MRKFIALMIGAIFLVGVVAVISVAEVNKGAETYTIDKCKQKKAPVKFNHFKHQGLEGATCKACHHMTEEGKTPGPCSQCHQCEEKGDIPSARIAFHKNCKGCHVKVKKAGKATGPTTCAGCHPEKK
jgi:hypothetical protein